MSNPEIEPNLKYQYETTELGALQELYTNRLIEQGYLFVYDKAARSPVEVDTTSQWAPNINNKTVLFYQKQPTGKTIKENLTCPVVIADGHKLELFVRFIKTHLLDLWCYHPKDMPLPKQFTVYGLINPSQAHWYNLKFQINFDVSQENHLFVQLDEACKALIDKILQEGLDEEKANDVAKFGSKVLLSKNHQTSTGHLENNRYNHVYVLARTIFEKLFYRAHVHVYNSLAEPNDNSDHPYLSTQFKNDLIQESIKKLLGFEIADAVNKPSIIQTDGKDRDCVRHGVGCGVISLVHQYECCIPGKTVLEFLNVKKFDMAESHKKEVDFRREHIAMLREKGKKFRFKVGPEQYKEYDFEEVQASSIPEYREITTINYWDIFNKDFSKFPLWENSKEHSIWYACFNDSPFSINAVQQQSHALISQAEGTPLIIHSVNPFNIQATSNIEEDTNDIDFGALDDRLIEFASYYFNKYWQTHRNSFPQNIHFASVIRVHKHPTSLVLTLKRKPNTVTNKQMADIMKQINQLTSGAAQILDLEKLLKVAYCSEYKLVLPKLSFLHSIESQDIVPIEEHVKTVTCRETVLTPEQQKQLERAIAIKQLFKMLAQVDEPLKTDQVTLAELKRPSETPGGTVTIWHQLLWYLGGAIGMTALIFASWCIAAHFAPVSIAVWGVATWLSHYSLLTAFSMLFIGITSIALTFWDLRTVHATPMFEASIADLYVDKVLATLGIGLAGFALYSLLSISLLPVFWGVVILGSGVLLVTLAYNHYTDERYMQQLSYERIRNPILKSPPEWLQKEIEKSQADFRTAAKTFFYPNAKLDDLAQKYLLSSSQQKDEQLQSNDSGSDVESSGGSSDDDLELAKTLNDPGGMNKTSGLEEFFDDATQNLHTKDNAVISLSCNDVLLSPTHSENELPVKQTGILHTDSAFNENNSAFVSNSASATNSKGDIGLIEVDVLSF